MGSIGIAINYISLKKYILTVSYIQIQPARVSLIAVFSFFVPIMGFVVSVNVGVTISISYKAADTTMWQSCHPLNKMEVLIVDFFELQVLLNYS
jgi:hypothetical protein